MNPLSVLHEAVEHRVDAIRQHAPGWLCGKGCDRCCRQLAALPQLTTVEWNLLYEGFGALPAEQQASVRRRLTALGATPTARVTCPLLDPASGACPVYAQRPVACRTYGFYVQRDKGLYCGDIEAQVASGALDDVVWGNHETIEQQLAALGEARSLHEWFVQSRVR